MRLSVCAFGLVRWGYLLLREAPRRRGFQRVRNSELRRRRVVSCFFKVSRRVSDGFRVRFVPGMCVSISFSWKSAWIVLVRANFVRMQFPVKISPSFVTLPA